MVRRRTAALLAGLLTVSLTLSGRATQDAAIVTELGVQVKMRDGVTLRADIYRPKEDGKFPVLLQRLLMTRTASAASA